MKEKNVTKINEEELLKYFNKNDIEEIRKAVKLHDKCSNTQEAYRKKSWEHFEVIRKTIEKFLMKSKEFFKGVWTFDCFSMTYGRKNCEIKLTRKLTQKEYDLIFVGFGHSFDGINIYNPKLFKPPAHLTIERRAEKMHIEFKTLDALALFMKDCDVAILNLDELKDYLAHSQKNVANLKSVIATQKGKKKIITAYIKQQKKEAEEARLARIEADRIRREEKLEDDW